MKPGCEVIEVNFEELAALKERARQGPLGEEDCQRLQSAIDVLSRLIELIGDKDTTLRSLRALLDKPSTEKTSKVLKQAGLGATSKSNSSPSANKKPKPGHGRNGAAAYREARRIRIAHSTLTPGDRCPRCLKGKVYGQKDPALRIRVVGQAPIEATVYELERLRCNLCGDVFEAEAPEGMGEKKYDETAAAMIALLRYGSGVPFYRLDGLEASLGIPLPSSTQWEIVAETAAGIHPAFDELIRQAAQAEVFYNDDTSMKVLALAEAIRAEVKEASSPGAAGGAVLHGTAARRGELRPGAGASRRGALSADSDVRRSFAKPAEAAEEVGNPGGELQCPCPTPFCGCDAQLSRGVPVRAGIPGRSLWL
jgi:transposase